MKNFAMIGAAGYIAPRHMQAIKETGNNLVAALDKNDSVGILDSYFPEATFFTEFERFDRYIDKLKRKGTSVDYMSIMSPNYLHDSHIRYALKAHAHAICEKPLVVNPWNLDALKELESESEHNVYNILQLRLHPNIIALRENVKALLKEDPNRTFDVDLTYLTSRGKWYFASWKGEEKKSGGIVANIGVHFFDMLSWVFGSLNGNTVHLLKEDSAGGVLEFEHARVRWFLGLDYDLIPEAVRASGARTYRSITLDGEEIEFSNGFTDLHTKSYQNILDGNGFGIEEAYPSIKLVHAIRTAAHSPLSGDYHPLLGRAK